jgi:hypothetical protein
MLTWNKGSSTKCHLPTSSIPLHQQEIPEEFPEDYNLYILS